MSNLRLNVLGNFEALLASGGVVSLPTRKAEALLTYLALAPGQPHSREKLFNLLWSDRGEEQARNSLRQCLNTIKKSFGDEAKSILDIERTTVSLKKDLISVDVLDFELLAREPDRESLMAAVSLNQGEFLEGISVREEAFQVWLDNKRDLLQQSLVDVLAQLSQLLLESRDYAQAIETAKRLVKLEPLLESAWRQLMKAYNEKGDRNHALKSFKQCQGFLSKELGVDPETATVELHDQIAGNEDTRKQDQLRTPTKPSAKATTAPDNSIAVLQFENLSGNPEQKYFSSGITEDIITDLSRFRDLLVIARNSTQIYDGKAVNIREIGSELDVRYILEGSVQIAREKVRVNAQLVDAKTDHHVWADRYDRELKDIFAVQDEITETIVSTLVGRLEKATLERARGKTTDNMMAHDYVLRADEDIFHYTKEKTAWARQLYLRAIELDPQYARAYAGMALTYATDWGFFWGEFPDDDLLQAFEYAQKAVALDDSNNRSHMVLAIAYLFQKKYTQARYHQEKAIALNPNDADVLAHMGYILPLLGNSEEAVKMVERAVRLNPFYPKWYLTFMGTAYYAAHRYADAISTFEGSKNTYPDDATWLAASYAQLGQIEKAHKVMSEFLTSAEVDSWWKNAPESAAKIERDPTSFLRYMTYMYPFMDQADRDHHIDGLRRAGLPE